MRFDQETLVPREFALQPPRPTCTLQGIFRPLAALADLGGAAF